MGGALRSYEAEEGGGKGGVCAYLIPREHNITIASPSLHHLAVVDTPQAA